MTACSCADSPRASSSWRARSHGSMAVHTTNTWPAPATRRRASTPEPSSPLVRGQDLNGAVCGPQLQLRPPTIHRATQGMAMSARGGHRQLRRDSAVRRRRVDRTTAARHFDATVRRIELHVARDIGHFDVTVDRLYVEIALPRHI